MASQIDTKNTMALPQFMPLIILLSGVATLMINPFFGLLMVTGGAGALAFPRYIKPNAQRFMKAREAEKHLYRTVVMSPYGIFTNVYLDIPVGLPRLYKRKTVHMAYAGKDCFENDPNDNRYRILKPDAKMVEVIEPVRAGVLANTPTDLADALNMTDVPIAFGGKRGMIEKIQIGLMVIIVGALLFIIFIMYSEAKRDGPPKQSTQTLSNGQVITR